MREIEKHQKEKVTLGQQGQVKIDQKMRELEG
jgi:hypothetical protein